MTQIYLKSDYDFNFSEQGKKEDMDMLNSFCFTVPMTICNDLFAKLYMLDNKKFSELYFGVTGWLDIEIESVEKLSNLINQLNFVRNNFNGIYNEYKLYNIDFDTTIIQFIIDKIILIANKALETSDTLRFTAI